MELWTMVADGEREGHLFEPGAQRALCGEPFGAGRVHDEDATVCGWCCEEEYRREYGPFAKPIDRIMDDEPDRIMPNAPDGWPIEPDGTLTEHDWSIRADAIRDHYA